MADSTKISKRFKITDAILIIVAFLAAYLIIGHPWQKQSEMLQQNVQSTSVKINDKIILVEVAETPVARAQGLMFRNELQQDSGMLFVFDSAGYHSFWMRNTFIPLDIIWIADGKIVHIESNVQPAGDALIPPTYEPSMPATHVLEVEAGTSEQYGWEVGGGVEFLNF